MATATTKPHTVGTYAPPPARAVRPPSSPARSLGRAVAWIGIIAFALYPQGALTASQPATKAAIEQVVK